jgi:hypothetical protein
MYCTLRFATAERGKEEISVRLKYKVDSLKSKHNYISYISNDGKTANNYMFRPLKMPSSGCAFSEKRAVKYTMYLLSDDEIWFIVAYKILLIKTRMISKYNATESCVRRVADRSATLRTQPSVALYLLVIRV